MNPPKPGETVVLKSLPPGLLDSLPEEDQRAISAMVGKPVLLVDLRQQDGTVELEFDDPFDVVPGHAIAVTPFGSHRSSSSRIEPDLSSRIRAPLKNRPHSAGRHHLPDTVRSLNWCRIVREALNLTAALLVCCVMVASCNRGPATVAGLWTIRMMPDFKGNQTIEKCTIQQQGERLSVRFLSVTREGGAEMVGLVAAHQAEWHWQSKDGLKVSFIADVGDAGTTMVGEWRLQFSDGTQSKGKFSGERAH